MRQAGVIAAAGVVALETMVERLADDHARARASGRRARRARSPAASIPTTVRTNIVCARARSAARRRSSTRSRPTGVRVGHRSTPTPSGSSRTRTSTTPASTAPSTRSTGSLADRAAAADRYTRTVPASDDVPARALAVYAHPDDPEISAGGTLATWAAAGHRGVGADHDPGRQGHARIPTPTSTRSPRCGSRRRPRRRRCSASPAPGTSTTPTASSPTTSALRGAIVRRDPRGAARRGAVPRPHRGVLRRRLLQPPRPPRHRVGDARRGRARGGQPALLPRAHRRGPRGAPRARRLPLGHARAELLDRHRRHARAQDRRAVLPRQPARPTTRATGSASSCASAPRTPAPPPACSTPSRSASSPSALA